MTFSTRRRVAIGLLVWSATVITAAFTPTHIPETKTILTVTLAVATVAVIGFCAVKIHEDDQCKRP